MEKKKYSSGSINITLAIPAELKAALEQLADETGITRNRLIVSAITAMLDKRRNG